MVELQLRGVSECNTQLTVRLEDMTDCNLISALTEGFITTGNPYNSAIFVFVLFSGITFATSTLTKNYSQTDKLWSIMPVTYAWIPVCDARTLIMAMLATIWGVRLTWNFNRRGGYKWPQFWQGDEDYRWKEIQAGKFLPMFANPIVWHLFNLLFISMYQMFILMISASPSYVAYTVAKCSPRDIQFVDWTAVVFFICFVVIESIADNQQYSFQTEKYRRKNAGEVLTGEFADGFKQSHLFAVVRKPNYAAEQGIWISFYLFSVGATGKAWNWSACGWIVLCLLFQTSAWFTERLTRAKYVKYNDYMRHVPLFVPNPLALLLRGQKAKPV
jgi:steroid 5-alpha reductase family enzyme